LQEQELTVISQSIQFIYPTVRQHKNEYQQNNVKHSDGLPEKANRLSELVAQISTKISK